MTPADLDPDYAMSRLTYPTGYWIMPRFGVLSARTCERLIARCYGPDLRVASRAMGYPIGFIKSVIRGRRLCSKRFADRIGLPLP